MSGNHQGQNTQAEDKKPFDWRTASLTGVFALLGVGVTGFLSVESALVSVHKDLAISCVENSYKQEGLIREKADAFLQSLGAFIAYTGDENASDAGIEEHSEAVMKAAFQFAAYAPPQLELRALGIAMAIRTGVTAKTSAAQEAALKAAVEVVHDWPTEYLKYMQGFETERTKCTS
jgi:hypothetical protein